MYVNILLVILLWYTIVHYLASLIIHISFYKSLFLLSGMSLLKL